jgi:hypothetical protein
VVPYNSRPPERSSDIGHFISTGIIEILNGGVCYDAHHEAMRERWLQQGSATTFLF